MNAAKMNRETNERERARLQRPLRRRSRGAFVLLAVIFVWGAVSARAAAAPAQGEAVQRYLRTVSARLTHIWVKVVLADVASTIVENDPFNDPRRKVTLRLHFSGEGKLEGAKVVRSSGYRPFDDTALHAVLLSHSYPRPPKTVRSDNGHVYLDWTFRRSKPYCRPAEKSVYRKLLPTRRAVRKFLRLGRFDRAVARLRLAHRKGKLAQAGHAFGLEVIRMAATQGRAVDAKHFVRTLADPEMPLEVFRALLGGLVGSDTHAAVVAHLVQRAQPVADRVMAMQFRQHYPDRPQQALVFLQGLLERPDGAKLVLPKLRKALEDQRPRLAAGAAALLLHTGRPADRNPALGVLQRLLAGSETEQQAALAVVGAVTRAAALYPAVARLAEKEGVSEKLRDAALLALARYGTSKALKQLLTLTYRRKQPKLQLAALEALATRERFPKSYCYRLMALIAKPRRPALLETAARALARGCLAVLPYEVRTAARNRRWRVRLGVASALPGAGALTDKILIRLARDRVGKVRLAALRNMARQQRAAFAPVLARAATRGSRAQRRIGLLHTKKRRLLSRALRRERGEWWLRIARHAIVVAPKLTFPRVLKMLQQSDWESRLQAAWVLMAFPPAK